MPTEQMSPAANAYRAEHDDSSSNPGPENRVLAQLNPEIQTPPPTDHGDVPAFWYSFDLAKKRMQPGGWSRQVNIHDLPIAKQIAGVNMRLTSGSIRELHWHTAAEWSIMLTGNARITALDYNGKAYVDDVAAGDLWFFPEGVPHSIQGLGPDGCEFLLVFDDGAFSEYGTTLLTDWTAHVPKDVLSKNWSVPHEALDPLPDKELFIFPAELPGPLEEDLRHAAGTKGLSTQKFAFSMHAMPPTKQTAHGEVTIVDSKVFPSSKTIAAAHVRVRPGGLREMHWHPNADEWQYYIEGRARMTLFMNHANARTMDFRANDVGYVPRTMGHYIENTGDTDLIFLEMFRSDVYQDFSLSEWLSHLPPKLVLQHLGVSRETFDSIPRENRAVVPA